SKIDGAAITHVTPERPICSLHGFIVYEQALSEFHALLFRGGLASPEDRLFAELFAVNVCGRTHFGGWTAITPATVEVTGLPVPDTIDQLSRYPSSTLPEPERLIGMVAVGQT